MKDLFGNNSNAIFSENRKYRYALWRLWDLNKPKIMFIGLNPSTANESKDDNTIKKVKKIAKNNGYGGVYMANLFGFITSSPKVLAACDNPLGDNNEWLITISGMCKDIVFAWGNFKVAQNRGREVIQMFDNAKCLAKNKNGSPKHPLFCLDNSQLLDFLTSS